MDSEYDQKFEEMKKYIPFLENMIKRLESTSIAAANPRQAQLDKIRSLRDLLLDKKKRMKMENLLKCEQVLVNLYTKVEQRDTNANPNFEATAQNSKSNDSKDLEVVRNKLKSVARSTTVEGQETLPEIARASAIEENCTPGSKEPALFQRRPNRASKSPVRSLQKSPNKAAAGSLSTKRNYTRVLLSPEPSSRRWDSDDQISDKPLFSRRSPRRSPKRYSPAYNKKERKKSSKQIQGKKSKDLNITLNVPEESLDSLNSKDILSRIMNCSDNDVDIETLREAKRQILNELKHTGAKCDDISDLLLKSYKKSSSSKKKDEVEEGELSDSESEAIQSIYGNFMLDESDTTIKDKTSKSKDKPRKIQICLVINSDKDDASCEVKKEVPRDTDPNDFEMYNKKSTSDIKQNVEIVTKESEKKSNLEENLKEIEKVEINEKDSKVQTSVPTSEEVSESKDSTDAKPKEHEPENTDATVCSVETTQAANFYKPLNEDKDLSSVPISEQPSVDKDIKDKPVLTSKTENLSEITTYLKDTESDGKDVIEIPLLHDQSIVTQKPKEDVVSEIDILQALKNEILSESLSIPGSETTPSMHQPKLTKVASIQDVVPKKRISIEKYKKKSIPSATTVNSLFLNDSSSALVDNSTSSKDDNLKKQSLKLTEKECERFNFPAKLAFDDDDDVDDIVSSEDEDVGKEVSINDIYGNLAPKSPDNNESSSIRNTPPIIIPVDPVKTVLAPSTIDVDMRTMMANAITALPSGVETKQEIPKNNIDKTKTPVDPRVRRDLSLSVDKDRAVHPSALDTDKLQRPVPNYTNTPNSTTNINPSITPNRTLLMTPSLTPNMTPNRNPNMTPSRVPNMTPNMTPSRNPNMTPNARSYEIGNRHQSEMEDISPSKHVYAPMFPLYDHRESREQSVAKEPEREPHWDAQIDRESKSRTRESRWGDSSENRDRNLKHDPRSHSVRRDSAEYSKTGYCESYNKYDNYNSRYNDRRDYSRSDCPRTPLPSFGRSEAPSTPSHPFGRLDSPMTPVHPFGRSDCPPTPNHPFGRSDCPPTPSHPFGRQEYTWNECPMTPSHSFGRIDMPSTPSHPFGRSETQSRDPRLNRMSDYDNLQKDDSDRNYRRDHNRHNYNNSYRSEPDRQRPESYRNYRERSVGRNERNSYPEKDSRTYNRDQSFRRESSIGRATPRDDRFLSKDRSLNLARNDHHRNNDHDALKKEFNREHCMGRSVPTDDRMHRSSSRASSVSRSDNKMSVEPDTGSSFTINTSVRSTFQDFRQDDKLRDFNYSFDGRQKRASSVGRTLCRESSVGRSQPNTEISKFNKTFENPDRSNFRRARSVGRDILTSERERTLKDLKADFENFSKQQKKNESVKTFNYKDPRSRSKYIESRNQSNQIVKKHQHGSVTVGPGNKKPYSPRKNPRDPRLRHSLTNTKNESRDSSSDEREKKNVGIVYSNDNITKGKILELGYGVKNYKIPKIKRPVEEKKEDQIEEAKKEELKEQTKKEVLKEETKKEGKESTGKDKKMEITKSQKNKNTEKLKNKSQDQNQKTSKPDFRNEIYKAGVDSPKNNVENVEKPEKRVTRLSKKNESSLPSSEDETATQNKPKKTKKAVIYDSDSDENEPIIKNSNKTSPETPTPKINQSKDTVTMPSSPKKKTIKSKEIANNEALNENSNTEISKEGPETETINEIPNDVTVKKIQNDNLEQSFAIDDLEIFSDNLASDPVIDNINALIADLDDDLEPSKMGATEFGDHITLENMLESIDSGDDNNSKILTEEFNDISEVIKNDMKQPSQSPKIDSLKNASSVEMKDNLEDKFSSLHTIQSEENITVASKSLDIPMKNQSDCERITNDNIDSTTEINKDTSSENLNNMNTSVLEASSVPDSTNEVNTKKPNLEDRLPDSTNETQTDINALVTSSHDSLDAINKENTEPSSCSKDAPSINSIGNILSILQNKSKLKEILSMLGDNSIENEKIKKKLEKLSEIVSDEDDEIENNHSEKSKINVSVESNKSHDKNVIVNEMPKENSASIADVSLDTSKEVLTQADKDKKNPEVVLETDSTIENPDGSNIENLPLEKETDELNTDTKTVRELKKPPPKKGKVTKKGKGKIIKKTIKGVKRVTRSTKTKAKKPSRELLLLQEDLKEMFISDDVLNATGIRMCRLAKLINDDNSKSKEDTHTNDSGPVVVLEKCKNLESNDESKPVVKNVRKKPGPKPKPKLQEIDETETKEKEGKFKPLTHKPGPKSKTKNIYKSDDEDPYAFETDSLSETNDSIRSVDDKYQHSSDTESESICSSQSFGSSDLLVEVKKKTKRRRSAWQSGVIKPKNKKKKLENKQQESSLNENLPLPEKPLGMPDINCFTDKSYCFYKNIFNYSCRLCNYNGENIVNHYKQNHPHSEIPLSRLSPEMAKEAIEQCGEINFQAISKVPSEKYVCRFCFREFGKKRAALEAFFWHIVSMHTGEYKHSCSLCVNEAKCPFNLDIPSPPKDVKGQLIGYICEKCNFTQISLENLKTHVIVRHNDEQTEVYTINLAVMSRKVIAQLLKRSSYQQPKKLRVLRSGRSNQSITETSDEHSDITDSDHSFDPSPSTVAKDSTLKPSINTKDEDPILPPSFSSVVKDPISPPSKKEKPLTTKLQSKIRFENDDSLIGVSNSNEIIKTIVKKEVVEEEIRNNKEIEALKNNLISEICGAETTSEATGSTFAADIQDCAHFKITYTESGSKEYVCCVNGIDNHYKTTLLISLKKHVQFKHSENWDGYCFLCKVIVTPQGKHKFKDCLEHFLDKHMDNFPVLEKISVRSEEEQSTGPPVEVQQPANKPYINVRPISELMSTEVEVIPNAALPSAVELPALPKIENVMSLGAQTAEMPRASPSYPTVLAEPRKDDKEYKFEEVQAEVMSKKHRVVLDTMMMMPKLINVFKCAGSYCSFTSDSAEQALLHASTHQRVGGENSLICSYCDFDCSGNAIDLVMHVFKAHGACPYVCGYCFYRAAASQLVTAHISRIHKDVPPKVLSVANAVPPQTKDSTMLKREDVVLYYICSFKDCNFRTYTAGRFCEHLVQQHPKESSFTCSVCKLSQNTPQLLIRHMKSHELNIYQCTWCVHGADSETGLLFHASQKHPDKQPLAYLRVITNKDGSSAATAQQLRVLPLVSFNKSKVAVTEIPKVANNENPVREAERSIELEKLIGHTKTMIESMESDAPETVVEPPTETESAVSSIMEESNITKNMEPTVAAVVETVSILPQQPVTPPSTPALSEQVTPKIKAEPVENTPTKALPTEVVCLDSDDESSRDFSSVIALSDDETVAAESPATTKHDKYKVVPISQLLKCPFCLLNYKAVGGFKRHTNSCTIACGRPWQCAHCKMPVQNRDALIKHYLLDHNRENCFNICDICKDRFPTLALLKTHLKSVHGVNKVVVWRRSSAGKESECFAGAAPPAAPKRKNSSGSTSEPPKKLKRFGPQDVDLLPINPILDESVSCTLCEFSTKVRINMLRHLQFHADQQPVAQTAPINPVPHLETNEKHFDKMVNLASSSIVTRAPEKPRPEGNTTVSVLIPPEAASRYPKYVPDKQRHTCGAKGCSYISLDEAMLRCHWETLHSGSNDFHCVHCPPYQHLDTSKPLTSARIIAHLKMHDATLYACSACAYYHYRKQVLEKHLSEVHKGSGRLMVVREEVMTPTPNPVQAAPTMDLKPWQCGLCSFKSMLRPEVVEHCSKSHQSKMQFKCSYCPFRTSALENVTKHQANSHPKKDPEVFYYYYREGSIADEADGTPKWMKQRQKMNVTEPEVKCEVVEPNPYLSQLLLAPAKPPTTPVGLDLNIVKQEVDDTVCDVSIERLVEKYGQQCEPNGLRYKCPLCKVVIEDTKESMQSHLYEELKYRTWSCALCSYKAFHKTGLNEHIVQEHGGQSQEPKQLPSDVNIEKWVSHILQHQTKSIEKNKENLSKQKMLTEKPAPSTSTAKPTSVSTEKPPDKYSMKELELVFGKLGVPNNMMFCCPKCSFKTKDEAAMRDHLESELTRIRWCCSYCDTKFQTYHEAQFHCKSVHIGGAARPIEAVRDPALRTAWVQAALQVQRLSMNCLPLADTPPPVPQSPPPPEDSLLVVRYEETVTPLEPQPRKRDIEQEKRPIKSRQLKCPHCQFKTKHAPALREHQLKHFNVKSRICALCDFVGTKMAVAVHLQKNHGCGYKPEYIKLPEVPSGPEAKIKTYLVDDTNVYCLICEKIITESETAAHNHQKIVLEIARTSDVVAACRSCWALRIDQASIREHHIASHPDIDGIDFGFNELFSGPTKVMCCGHCTRRFKDTNLLFSHQRSMHGSLPAIFTTAPYFKSRTLISDSEDDESTNSIGAPKRVARKSTTKLPAQAVAKKSTTKLPYDVADEEMTEYSYYGTRPPSADRYENVTTVMSFYNTMVPFTMKKLSQVININPTVVVQDIRSEHLHLQ
ncbi:unnamed protein product [Chilo suppressalis]|uniref:C2H2-type domain-containing protein n=1 Tax=Chilo suppressalis TaxID=168631 RepID=A0ABN8B4B9_CHISP|nr:unnamed protein product [Chilo suppressalis]